MRKNVDVDKMTKAIEADAGHAVEGLRKSLEQMKAGLAGRVHTADQIAARGRGRPPGTVKAVTKQATTLRLDEQVLARWRASGKGWQTRAAQLLAMHAPQAASSARKKSVAYGETSPPPQRAAPGGRAANR